jgi:deoxyribonuclease-4
MKLGGHLSPSEGLSVLVMEARALGYDLVQTMLGDPRSYQPREITPQVAQEYAKMAYGITTYVHMPYIINPCESVPQRRGFYKRVFKEFAETAASVQARGLVIHPGFKKDLTEAQAFKNLVTFFESSMEEDWRTQVLLEVDAGSKNGSAIGSPDFIRRAIDELGTMHYGMCLDTTHLYARGVDLWDEEVRKDFLEEYANITRLVHLNVPDPEVALGSHLDAHNSPFESRPDWNHGALLLALEKFPCILERRSLAVQSQDSRYIREYFKETTNHGNGTTALPGRVQGPAEGH